MLTLGKDFGGLGWGSPNLTDISNKICMQAKASKSKLTFLCKIYLQENFGEHNRKASMIKKRSSTLISDKK